MAYKNKIVEITLKVKLSVPPDNEYDEVSYFQALKEVITVDGEEWLEHDCLEEVDSTEVTLVPECSQDGGECADHMKHYGGN